MLLSGSLLGYPLPTVALLGELGLWTKLLSNWMGVPNRAHLAILSLPDMGN